MPACLSSKTVMIETGERLKRTLFIMTKHSRRSFGVSTYSVSSHKTTFRQQLNGEKWGVELNLKQVTVTIILCEIKAVVRSHNEENTSIILNHEPHAHTHS